MQANFDLISELRGAPRMADFFIDTLARAGCVDVFGLAAESLNPVLDAMRRNGRLRLIAVRHEGNGALMASAYAKLSGRLTMCMGTAGPGATHLPVGAYDARGDGAPLVVFSGQVWDRMLGAGGFQEVDSVGLEQDAAHTSRLIGSVQQTDALMLSVASALQRRTSVHVAIPCDVASARLRGPVRARLRPDLLSYRSAASKDVLPRAQALLAKPGRSALLLGDAGGDVQSEVEELAAALRAPIFVLPEGLQHGWRTPRELTLRLVGRADDARALLARAERVVAVGRTSTTLATLLEGISGPIVQIARDHERYFSSAGLTFRLIGDVAALLRSLNADLAPGDEGYLRDALALSPPELPGAPPAALWDALDRVLDADATVSLEPGLVLDSACRDFAVQGRRVTSSFQLGARGYALTGCLAGALSRPRTTSVGIASPAGLCETIADLVTARKYNLPVQLVCVPGAGHQPRLDWEALGAAVGYSVQHVASPAGIEPALREQLRENKPGLLVLSPEPARPAAVEVRGDAPSEGDTLGARLIEALLAAKVTRVYARPSPLLAPFFEQLRRDGRIRCVTVTQAESASMMASAYAKWTGTLGVVLSADAADLVNQMNGIYDAAFDHARLLVLTGPSTRLFDPFKLLKDVALVSRTLTPEEAPARLSEVLSEAYRHRGVAHLAVDWNELERRSPPLPEWFWPCAEPELVTADAAALDQAVEALAAAKRPLVLVGRGAAEAAAEIAALADYLGAPVVSTMPGRGIVPDSHPSYVGSIGASGHRSAIDALEGCDVLVSVGCSTRGAIFGFVGRFLMIQIDRDALQLGRRQQRTIGLCGSAQPTVAELLRCLRAKRGAPRADDGHRRRLRARLERFCERSREFDLSLKKPIRPPAICSALQKALAECTRPAVITVDVGVTTLWVYRHLVGGGHQTIWTSSFATMGFAVPAALAIADLEPERPIVAIAGDGGLGITMAELASAGARKVPFVAIVFNNGKLAAIKYEQEVMGWPEFESGLDNPDFAQYARACGVDAVRVTEPSALLDAMREALRSRRPCLLDVICDPHDMPAPPRVHPRQAAGYLLAASREGRNGLKELARQVLELGGAVR